MHNQTKLLLEERVLSKNRAVTSQTPSSAAQPISSQASFKRFGKKLYAAIAVLAIVIVAVAFFIPQGTATIPLNVNYVIGEKMVYDSTLTMTLDSYSSGSALKLPAQSPNS